MEEIYIDMYQEVLEDICYEVGAYRLRLSFDSRSIKPMLKDWATQFTKKHTCTDWDDEDYLSTLLSFVDENMKNHYTLVDCQCPGCESTLYRYERLSEGNEEYHRAVCCGCGRMVEEEEAKDMLYDSLNEILSHAGKENEDIEEFLHTHMQFIHPLSSKEDLISEFEDWKEKSDIEFEKIQDRNYWSSL